MTRSKITAFSQRALILLALAPGTSLAGVSVPGQAGGWFLTVRNSFQGRSWLTRREDRPAGALEPDANQVLFWSYLLTGF